MTGIAYAKNICPYASKPHTHLISSEDPEGCHNLLGSVCISSLSGHKVDERLEGNDSRSIGVYQHHYASKLHLSLK